jgi:ABC-type antimicrobial peptide transport system permease subunit
VLVGGFALVALVLSVVGIYGVMAYFVQQNRREISIRLALGGSTADVLRRVIGHGMTAVVAGIAVGVLIAFATTRLMSTLLFGVTSGDASTFSTVGAFLVAVALVACLVPARRAAALQPAATLREE